jgi:hypothetical protein
MTSCSAARIRSIDEAPFASFAVGRRAEVPSAKSRQVSYPPDSCNSLRANVSGAAPAARRRRPRSRAVQIRLARVRPSYELGCRTCRRTGVEGHAGRVYRWLTILLRAARSLTRPGADTRGRCLRSSRAPLRSRRWPPLIRPRSEDPDGRCRRPARARGGRRGPSSNRAARTRGSRLLPAERRWPSRAASGSPRRGSSGCLLRFGLNRHDRQLAHPRPIGAVFHP